MKYLVDNVEYDVIIERKNNKNTYLRVKDNLTISVATNYFVTTKQIIDLLDNNYDSIKKMIVLRKNKNERQEYFYLLGKIYDIIIVPTFESIEIVGNKIFVKSKECLNKWFKKKIVEIYKDRLDTIYNRFEEKIPYPNLKVRKMTTRWGVCNRKNNNITLNSELIKYGYDQIDYVIVHELSHFIHFDHSSLFWSVVSKYCPNYKKIRKSLKE